MKKIIGLLILTVLVSHPIFAQKEIINDAVITYTVKIIDAKGESNTASAMSGATLTIYLKKDQSKTTLVNKLGAETNCFDAKTQKGFIVKEYNDQKLMITLSGDNWNQKNAATQKLVFGNSETTEKIAGYDCNKVTAEGKDGKKYIVWYDANNVLGNKTYNNAFAQINGLPVQYQMQSGNLTFQYTMQKFEANVVSPNATFEPPKAGRTMTFEESQQLKKGG
jgi:hypothetical protein